jgi:hypothetical protein
VYDHFGLECRVKPNGAAPGFVPPTNLAPLPLRICGVAPSGCLTRAEVDRRRSHRCGVANVHGEGAALARPLRAPLNRNNGLRCALERWRWGPRLPGVVPQAGRWAPKTRAGVPVADRKSRLPRLRGCDVVSLRVEDVAPHGHAVDRATVRQKKTAQPVRFEMTEQTREAVDSYLGAATKKPCGFLFGGHRGRDRRVTTPSKRQVRLREQR